MVLAFIVPANSKFLLAATGAKTGANASPFVVAINIAQVPTSHVARISGRD